MSSTEGFVLTPGQKAVVIHTGDAELDGRVVTFVKILQTKAGSEDCVHLQSLKGLATLVASSFDVVCIVDPVTLDVLNLAAVLQILKPKGTLWIQQLALTSASGSEVSVDRVRSELTLNGFINSDVKVSQVSDDDEIRQKLNLSGDFSLCSLHAFKPNYEIGYSAPIKLQEKDSVAKAWTLSAQDMVDDDIMDSDAVLDADDLKKPDPSTLRATCGVETEGPAKRKACKNCTCGLAEEIEAENLKVKAASQLPTSSCGNCYLGDAFRCAKCPYRGMPAFKPGEKVQLPTAMQDDL